jgi:hypothetical protein
MTNPLSRMAKADEVTGFTRLVEIGIQAAGAGATRALKRINFDKGMVAAADVLGVPPSLLYSDEEMDEQDEADAPRKRSQTGRPGRAARSPAPRSTRRRLIRSPKISARAAAYDALPHSKRGTIPPTASSAIATAVAWRRSSISTLPRFRTLHRSSSRRAALARDPSRVARGLRVQLCAGSPISAPRRSKAVLEITAQNCPGVPLILGGAAAAVAERRP